MVWSWSVRIGVISVYGLLILIVFQDVLECCICNRVEIKCLLTGIINSGVTVLLAEVYYSHAGFICLFLKVSRLKEKTIDRTHSV